MSIQRIIPLALLAMAVLACQVTPVTNGTTPPTLTVTLMDKLGNQGFANNQTVVPANGLVTLDPNMDILIVISGTDPGGMNTLTGSIWFYVNACGSTNGGGFPDTLTGINETATHNPPNTVTNTLPFLYEVTTAGLKAQPCYFNATGSSGLGTVMVQVTATDQSNLSTSVKDYLHTTGGVIPQ